MQLKVAAATQRWAISYLFNCKAWWPSSRFVCGDPRRLAPPVQLAAGRRPPGRRAPQHQDHHRRLLQPHQHIIPHRGPRRHIHLLGGKRGRLSKAFSSTAGELILQLKCDNIGFTRWMCHHVGLSVRQTAPGFRATDSRFAVGQAEGRTQRWILGLVGNPEYISHQDCPPQL